MTDMTHREPDSAAPTGEPASAVPKGTHAKRVLHGNPSPGYDPRGKLSLCLRAGFSGLRSPCREKRERARMLGLGGEVVGDGRVGSVDEISRETRRGQIGVHGLGARRAARRESERP